MYLIGTGYVGVCTVSCVDERGVGLSWYTSALGRCLAGANDRWHTLSGQNEGLL